MDGLSVVTCSELEMLGPGSRCSGGQTDSDRESVVSDYSEMADPVKEHLASIRLLQEAELHFGGLLGMQQSCGMRSLMAIQRRPDEDEVEFFRRQRKINFLSLAQEFAAIKKVNSDALPFNAHVRSINVSCEEESSKTDEVSLAQELASVSCDDKLSPKVDDNDTVIGSEKSDDCSGFNCQITSDLSCSSPDSAANDSKISDADREDDSTQVDGERCSVPDVVGLCSNKQSPVCKLPCVEVRHVAGHSTAVLNLTDSDLTAINTSETTVTSTSKDTDLLRQREREKIRLKLVVTDDDNDRDVFGRDAVPPTSCNTMPCPESSASLSVCYLNEAASDEDDDSDSDVDNKNFNVMPQSSPDLITSVRSGAQPKVLSCGDNIDRNTAEQTVELIAERGHMHEAGLVEWKLNRFNSMSLQRLNAAQLQVIVNDQLSKIEGLNNELVEYLMERDDLHRVQDSLLIDIEDLSRFLTKATGAEALPEPPQ